MDELRKGEEQQGHDMWVVDMFYIYFLLLPLHFQVVHIEYILLLQLDGKRLQEKLHMVAL